MPLHPHEFVRLFVQHYLKGALAIIEPWSNLAQSEVRYTFSLITVERINMKATLLSWLAKFCNQEKVRLAMRLGLFSVTLLRWSGCVEGWFQRTVDVWWNVVARRAWFPLLSSTLLTITCFSCKEFLRTEQRPWHSFLPYHGAILPTFEFRVTTQKNQQMVI